MLQSELAGKAQVAKQCKRQRKDGSLIDVCISTLPLRNPQGLITGSLKIFSAISAALGRQEEKRNIKGEGDRLEPFWARYVSLPHLTNK